MEESFIDEYRVSLSDLNFNSKPHINMLTMLAEENIKNASLVVETIVAHIKEVPPESKLPGLYLVDSIMKNIAGQYITLFSKHVVSLFTSVFRKVDESTRSSLYKLRQTWDNLLSKKIMYELDCSIKKLDPAWPVTAMPPAIIQQPASKKPKVFVNPEFFSGTMGQKAVLRDKGAVKPANKGSTVLELLAEQKKKLEMRIAAAQQKDFPEKMEISSVPRDPRLIPYSQHQANLKIPPDAVPITHFPVTQGDKQKTMSTALSKKPLPSNGPTPNIAQQTPPIPPAVSVPNAKPNFNRTPDSSLVSNESAAALKQDRSSTPPVKSDVHIDRPNDSKSSEKQNDKSLSDKVEEPKDRTLDKKRSCSPVPQEESSSKKICRDPPQNQMQEAKNSSQSSDGNGSRDTYQKSFNSKRELNRIKSKSRSGSKSSSPVPDTEKRISTPPLFGNEDKDYRHLTMPVQSDSSHSSNVPYRDLGAAPLPQDSMSVPKPDQILESKEPPGVVIKTEPVDVESIKPVSAKDRLPPVVPVKPFKLDGKDRNLYFVDDRAFVILDNNEPFEISFHGPPKKVFIDGYPFPINLEFDGQAVEVNINGKPNLIKFGTPTREVYVNKYPYEGQFGGPPFRVLLANDVEHFTRIEGPPPKVIVSEKPAYELYEAYKRTQSVPVIEPVKCIEGKSAFADVDMRLRPRNMDSKDMDWRQSGVMPPPPMEVCIGSYMTSVIPAPPTLWQGPLNVPIKSEPLSVSNPSANLGMRMPAMLPPLPLPLVSIKVEKPSPPIPILDQLKQLNKMAPVNPSIIGTSSNVIRPANVKGKGPWKPLPPPPPFPGSTISTKPTVAAPVESNPPAPVNVESIFKKLVAAGIIPKVKEEPKSPEPEKSDDKPGPEEQNLAIFEKPIPKIRLKSKQMKNFHPGVIGALYRGSQCATCGMRFKEIQSEQYSRHLDWHFRMNRREKDGVKKAFSRRLYYRIDDWSDFKEIEEAEERAPSYFELQAVGESLNIEEHEKISSVPASECENERCSVCGEPFQLFWVEEDEEWHLRNAVRHDEEAYHPACYEDFKKEEELEKAKSEVKEESADAESEDKTDMSDVEVKVEAPDVENAEEPMEQEKSEETPGATEEVKVKVEKESEKDTTDENEADKDKSETEEDKGKDQASEVEKTSGGESDSDEEPEFRPPTPDPRFQILPPVQKGTELSALCVIM